MDEDRGVCFLAVSSPIILSGVYAGFFLASIVTAFTEPTIKSWSFVSIIAVSIFSLVRTIILHLGHQHFAGDTIDDPALSTFYDSFPDALFFAAFWLLMLDGFESFRDAVEFRIRKMDASMNSRLKKSKKSAILQHSMPGQLVSAGPGFSEYDSSSGENTAVTTTTTTPLSRSNQLRSHASDGEEDSDVDQDDFDDGPTSKSQMVLSSTGSSLSHRKSSVKISSPATVISPSKTSSSSSGNSSASRGEAIEHAAVFRLVNVPTETNNALLKAFLEIKHKSTIYARIVGVVIIFFSVGMLVAINAAFFKKNTYQTLVIAEGIYRLFCCLATIVFLVCGFIAFNTVRPAILVIMVTIGVRFVFPFVFVFGNNPDCTIYFSTWITSLLVSESPLYFWLLFLCYHNGRVLLTRKKKELNAAAINKDDDDDAGSYENPQIAKQ